MTVAECHFLDVGQGTANAVILKNRRGLLLDAGPARVGATLKFLQRYVDRLECVVLSHTHADHIAGWERIALNYQDAIDAIWVLEDRPIPPRKRPDVTMNLASMGRIPRPRRAEVKDLKKPEVIWSDADSGIRLELLYPDMLANVTARSVSDPNQTSAIAALCIGSSRILFPGDSTIQSWKTLAAAAGESTGMPIGVDVLAMPHHGGLLSGDGSDLDWLLTEALSVDNAIISVGTINNHRHPRSEIITSLRKHGISVMCTQITSSCHNKLESIRPGVLTPITIGDSEIKSSFTQSGKSRKVACAGTVVATIQADGTVEIERVAEHSAAVRRKVSTPLCC